MKFDSDDVELDDDILDDEYGNYLGDLKALAKHYIEVFFKDKQFYCGGKIPKHLLYNPKYISYILNLDVHNGIDMIYEIIGASTVEDLDDEKLDKCPIPDDVRRVISLFNMCAYNGIPKQFSVGLTLIYLELCEGHKLPK